MEFYIEDGRITDDNGREITREELNRMLGDSSGGLFARTPSGYMTVDEGLPTLPAAAYKIVLTRWGQLFFSPFAMEAEKPLALPDTAVLHVNKEIERFWNINAFFQSRGYTKKRGILLYGPPGTGKTCCLNRIQELMIEQNGVIFYADTVGALVTGLKAFRAVEKDRPILCVLEDVENY